MTQTMQAPPTTDMPQYTITDDDRKRQKQIAEAWKAYYGELDKPLQVLHGQLDDNVMDNRCAPIVYGGVYFLFGKELEISVEEGGPQEAQDFLNDAWGRKEVRIPLLMKLGMNGANGRNAFLRIVPSTDEITQATTFRLITVDPATVFPLSAPQDVETILLFCIQYSVMQMVDGREREVYFREEITRLDPDGNPSQGKRDDKDTWIMRHWTFMGQHGQQPRLQDWKPAGPPILWPYPFAPIDMCQNLPIPNDVWGEPDITPDLIDMNNAINFVQSNINKIIKIYGHPMIYASGLGDSDLHTEPGRVTLLPVDGKMGAVQVTSDLPNALAFAANLRSDMDERSHVPAVATGRLEGLPRGQISGVALELLFMPLIKKTEAKQCLYGKLIIDVSKALLVLNGFTEDIDITLNWQSPLPADDLQSAQYAVLLKQLGISDTTIQRKLGFDPEEEAKLTQEENQQKMIAFSRGQDFPPDMTPPGQPGMPPQAPMPGMQGQGSPFIGGY
jgi:hypothetical protein